MRSDAHSAIHDHAWNALACFSNPEPCYLIVTSIHCAPSILVDFSFVKEFNINSSTNRALLVQKPGLETLLAEPGLIAHHVLCTPQIWVCKKGCAEICIFRGVHAHHVQCTPHLGCAKMGCAENDTFLGVFMHMVCNVHPK